MHYVSFHSSIVPNYDFVNINEMWMDSIRDCHITRDNPSGFLAKQFVRDQRLS